MKKGKEVDWEVEGLWKGKGKVESERKEKRLEGEGKTKDRRCWKEGESKVED